MEETTRAGALILAVSGGLSTVVGLGLLLLLPHDVRGRAGVGGALLLLGLMLLLILGVEVSGAAA